MAYHDQLRLKRLRFLFPFLDSVLLVHYMQIVGGMLVYVGECVYAW